MFEIPTDFSSVDVIHQSYRNCVKNNAMDEDCFVGDTKGTIKCIIDTIKDITLEELSMSGIDVTCGKSLLHDNRRSSLRFVIGVWKWKLKHFVIMDGKHKDKSGIIYDPLKNSLTVKYGKIIGARIVTRKLRAPADKIPREAQAKEYLYNPNRWRSMLLSIF